MLIWFDFWFDFQQLKNLPALAGRKRGVLCTPISGGSVVNNDTKQAWGWWAMLAVLTLTAGVLIGAGHPLVGVFVVLFGTKVLLS